jgi:hypothetical protein
MPSAKEVIKTLHDALVAASEHLNYCGYGDSWERECATEAKLPETIQAAIDQGKAFMELEEKPPAKVMDVPVVTLPNCQCGKPALVLEEGQRRDECISCFRKRRTAAAKEKYRKETSDEKVK